MPSADAIFETISTIVLPGWLLLLVLPRWKFTHVVVLGLIIPVLSIAYFAVLGSLFVTGDGFSPDAFGSLEGVMGLLSNPYAATAGWAHYLAFDLFVGAWIVRDAQANRVPHLLFIVPLFFTFMAGPFGLLLYLIMRSIARREVLATPALLMPR